MSVVVLKIILIIVMGVVGFVCGALPVKLYDYLQRQSKSQKYSSLVISLLSCFAGGVILGVCLLDMLPEAREDLETLEKNTNWKAEYPLMELFIGIGFFFVYFLEEVVDRLCDHGHGQPRKRKLTLAVLPENIKDQNANQVSVQSIIRTDDSNGKLGPDRPLSPGSIVCCDIVEDPDKVKRERRKALVSSLTLVLALAIHVFLEGFAFGVQDTTASVTSLFFGIIVHKALVMFSVGMSLTEKLADRKWVVICLITALNIFAPLSATIGLIIQDSDINTTAKAIVSTILTCFSIGCFLFIAFFDILATERKNEHNNILQWIACLGGFIATALMVLITHE